MHTHEYFVVSGVFAGYVLAALCRAAGGDTSCSHSHIYISYMAVHTDGDKLFFGYKVVRTLLVAKGIPHQHHIFSIKYSDYAVAYIELRSATRQCVRINNCRQ